MHFSSGLTQIFSLQQNTRFSSVRLWRTVMFARLTKNYLTEMTPLLKASQRAARKELRQKTMRFLFAWSARVREKRLNAAWKIYVSGPLYGELP